MLPSVSIWLTLHVHFQTLLPYSLILLYEFTVEKKKINHSLIVHINPPDSSIFIFQPTNSNPERNKKEMERAFSKLLPVIWKLSYYCIGQDQQEDVENSQADTTK